MRQDEKVAAHVRALIKTGDLQPGDRLPFTHSELAERLGVNKNSVFWGLTALRSQEIIIGVQGGRAVVSSRAREIVDLLEKNAVETSGDAEATEEL